MKNPLNDCDYEVDGDDQIDDLKVLVRRLMSTCRRLAGNTLSIDDIPIMRDATYELKKAVIAAGGFEIVLSRASLSDKEFSWRHTGSAIKSVETYATHNDALNNCFKIIASHINNEVTAWDDMSSDQQIAAVREEYNVDRLSAAATSQDNKQITETRRLALIEAGYSFMISDFKRPYWEVDDVASEDYDSMEDAINAAWENKHPSDSHQLSPTM